MDAEFTKPAYAPLTLDKVFAAVDRLKKTVICAPDVYAQVRAAVHDVGLGGLYRVVEHRWLDDGQVVLGPSEAEMMDVPLPELPQVATPPLDLLYGFDAIGRWAVNG